MKRFFHSPQPLAFFGFLLTFLLTVAWRVPLQGGIFGVAQAATAAAPAPIPEPVPAADQLPIPQPMPMTLPPPPAAMPVMAPAPTMFPAFAQAMPAETADVGSLPNAIGSGAKKKARHPHKAKGATATPSADDGLANLMSAATEGKTTKKRAHRE